MESLLEKLHPTHPDLTPNPDMVAYSTVEEAINALGPLDISPDTTPDQAGQLTMQKIEEVQAIVRGSLRFNKNSTPTSLEESQETDCTGYTVVGSEALERVGVRHSVIFVNGHAAIIAKIPSPESKRLHFTDMLAPDLSQDLTDKISLYSDANETVVDDETIRRTFGIINNSDLKIPIDITEAIQSYPWIAIKGKGSINRPESLYDHNLLLTMLEPAQGREILTNYGLFRQMIEANNLQAAAESVIRIKGVFPDIDIRGENAAIIPRLVKKLCAEREYDTAQEVTGAFYSSFVGADTRVFEGEGDCLRIIAKASGRKGLARSAHELYEKSKRVKRTAMASSVQGKIAVSAALAESLKDETASQPLLQAEILIDPEPIPS